MYGLTRGVTLLFAAAIAGGLVWLAGWIGPRNSTGEYWAAMGVLAGAGLVLVLSQLVGGWTKWGRPTASVPVFVLGFVPVLITAGWVLVAAQPSSNATRDRVLAWSSDLGIGGVVTDLVSVVGAIAFAFGLVFGMVFDTSGERRRVALDEHDRHAPEDYRDTTEPTAAERGSEDRAAGGSDQDRPGPQPVGVGGRPSEDRATTVPPPTGEGARPRTGS